MAAHQGDQRPPKTGRSSAPKDEKVKAEKAKAEKAKKAK